MFGAEICSTVVQHNLAGHSDLGTFLPSAYLSSPRFRAGNKAQEETGEDNQAVIICHHRANSCGFSLTCFRRSSHHHNPFQPGLPLLFCTTLQLWHITIFKLLGFQPNSSLLCFIAANTAICRALHIPVGTTLT